MANETGKWTLIGVILGLVFIVIMYVAGVVGAPHYTDVEKEELNQAFAVNCSKCLVEYNVTCTPDDLIYSHWGPICGEKYINKNCTQCRRI
jgi:hypothetical protein